MTEAEKRLLQDFAQTRIESHFRRYLNDMDTDEVNEENEVHTRFHSMYMDLSEENQKIAENYDRLMFRRLADKEQTMYYAGFYDGIRAARLFHEIEEEPLSE